MTDIKKDLHYKMLEWHKTNLLIKVGELQSAIEEIEEKQAEMVADSDKKAAK